MKNLNKLCLLVLIFGIISLTSCHKEEAINTETNEINNVSSKKSLEIDYINKLLEEKRIEIEESSKLIDKFKIVSFEVVKNLNSGEITLENFELNSFFPISKKEDYQQRSGRYQVDCDLPGENNDWSESCGSKWSCGSLIADCLEAGGCATICNQKSSSNNQYSSVKVFYYPKKQ